jgi:hypothetical protein
LVCGSVWRGLMAFGRGVAVLFVLLVVGLSGSICVASGPSRPLAVLRPYSFLSLPPDLFIRK